MDDFQHVVFCLSLKKSFLDKFHRNIKSNFKTYQLMVFLADVYNEN